MTAFPIHTSAIRMIRVRLQVSAICSVLAVLPVAVMTFPATFVEKKLHMALLSFTSLSVHIGDVG